MANDLAKPVASFRKHWFLVSQNDNVQLGDIVLFENGIVTPLHTNINKHYGVKFSATEPTNVSEELKLFSDWTVSVNGNIEAAVNVPTAPIKPHAKVTFNSKGSGKLLFYVQDGTASYIENPDHVSRDVVKAIVDEDWEKNGEPPKASKYRYVTGVMKAPGVLMALSKSSDASLTMEAGATTPDGFSLGKLIASGGFTKTESKVVSVTTHSASSAAYMVELFNIPSGTLQRWFYGTGRLESVPGAEAPAAEPAYDALLANLTSVAFDQAIADKLSAKKLALPPAVAPVFSYVPTVRTGNQLWVAGQIPRHADGNSTLIAAQRTVCDRPLTRPAVDKGKLGAGGLSIEEGQAAACICVLNGLSQVRAALGSLSNVVRVIKLVVFVASKEGAPIHP